MRTNPLLVLEDEFLIADDIEANLKEFGFADVHVCNRVDEAEAWLKCHTPVFAVLDLHLHSGDCLPVASILSKRRVPFTIYSGSPPGPGAPELLRNAP